MSTPPIRTEAAAHGSWASAISAEMIAGDTLRFGQIAVAGSLVCWVEGRPQDGGRNVLVRQRPDAAASDDVNPAPFNVRSRVHEYGGGAFVLLGSGGGVVFSHDDDQRLYRIDDDAPDRIDDDAPNEVRPLTASAGMRYADAAVDARRGRLVCVREDHHGGGGGGSGAEAVNALVAVDLASGAERVLASGHDFYSNPRPSPDGRQLAWLAWDHPNMPWDATGLWLADLQPDGTLGQPRRVAGGGNDDEDESILQPSWSPSGVLHFVSDRSGWWNLYRIDADGQMRALHPLAAEFGEPPWAFGASCYGFDAAGRIVCACVRDGESQLLLLDADDERADVIATPFRVIHDLQVGSDFIAFNGATADAPECIVRLDLATGRHRVLRSASSVRPEPAHVSVAEAISFPTGGDGDGDGDGGAEAHGFYYAPRNPACRGPDGERPPLIVMAHGGPTGSATAAFKWVVQFWTSRGFAVVDVNYGGSSGYGRAYRKRLDGQWGVVDVDDCIAAARFLAARGDVDADRIAIRGGSAGGYTTLCALTFRSFFKAGASHYGIGDLEALVRDTHKFESRYLDRLIGPYPQARALYAQRSPVNSAATLASPVILFQGAEDKAVPPSQAQTMFDAVRARGLPVAYLLFEREQHGFRRAETIKRVLQAELYFYGRIFGFTPAEAIDPVPIANLPAPAGGAERA